MAREGEGAQFDSDPQRTRAWLGLQVRLQSNCITFVPKKDSVCSDHIQKWVYWWASNYASPGLLFCVAEGPAPRHLQGRHAGG